MEQIREDAEMAKKLDEFDSEDTADPSVEKAC